MIRAYISISTGSHLHKYVRDSVVNGEDGQIYLYGDDVGDTLGTQTGAGKVLGDFNSLMTSAQSSTGEFLSFPESGGDTTVLTRINPNEALGVDELHIDNVGDSRITPVYKISIKKSGIRSINIVEERESPFFKEGFNSNINKYKRDDYVIYDRRTAPLKLDGISTLDSVFGDTIDIPLPVAQGGVPPYTYSARNIPGGTNLISREVIGTISEAGTITTEYTAQDSEGNTITKRFYWNLVPGFPGAPMNFVVSKVSSSALGLTWDAPTMTGGSPTLNYRITKSTDGESFVVINRGTTEETYGDSNVMVDNTYHYKVFTINSRGSSVGIGDSFTLLTFGFSTSIDSEITSDYGENNQFPFPPLTEGTPPYSYSFSGLPPGATTSGDTGGGLLVTTFLSQIGTFNPVYMGTDSTGDTASHYFTWIVQPILPDQPIGAIFGKVSGVDAIDISWTAPSNNGGDSNLFYRIDKSTDGNTYEILAARNPDDDYGDSDVIIGNSYYYRIYTVNGRGTSTSYIGGQYDFFAFGFLSSLQARTNNYGDDVFGLYLPAVRGGDPPYTISIMELPTGVELFEGEISGFFDRIGVYDVVYTATDSLNEVIGDSFVWTIRANFPSIPRNLMISRQAKREILVDWDIASNNGGDSALTYGYVFGGPSGVGGSGTGVSATQRSFTRGSNFDNGLYQVLVRTTNSRGSSSYIGDSADLIIFGFDSEVADQTNDWGDTVNLVMPDPVGASSPFNTYVEGFTSTGLVYDETARTVTGTIGGPAGTQTIEYILRDDDGDSFIDEFSWVINGILPGAPTNLLISSGNTSFTLTWDHGDSGGLAREQSRIYYSTDNAGTWIEIAIVGAAVTSYSDTWANAGIISGTGITNFSIIESNTLGDSPRAVRNDAITIP